MREKIWVANIGNIPYNIGGAEVCGDLSSWIQEIYFIIFPYKEISVKIGLVGKNFCQ